MEAIFERRSIRKYTNEKISADLINDLLKAGMAAPSAHNDQPWHFIVIDDKSLFPKITEIQPYSQPLLNAQCAIIVCGDLELKRYEGFEGFWVQDCSAATQNILLAAQSAGLGAVWMGLYPVEEWVSGIKKIFNLPEKVVPLSLIAVGYPGGKRTPVERYKPERIHKNRW